MDRNTNLQLSAISDTCHDLSSDRHWYAIYTRSHFEKKVYQELQESKFQAFLPLIKEYRAWSDRVKRVSVPLIPSYVFVKLDRKSIPSINYCPGVVRIVTFENKPCEVREVEIHLLEQIMTHGIPVQHVLSYTVGDSVRIIRGPLKGWEGNIETKKGQSRIVLQISSIAQSISVEVGLGDIGKAEFI